MKKRKKVCVISSYAYIDKNINYGALLQYYALEKALNNLECDAQWLRMCLPDYYRKSFIIKSFIKNLLMFNKAKLINKCLKSFKEFLNKYCKTSNEIYYSEAELEKNCPQVDIYITGSDQVWGGTFAPNYLTFVDNSKIKVSYAASFGKNTISDEQKKIIKPWLEKFDKISVREDSGVDICESMGIKATQVIDPTLLIDSTEYPVINNMNCSDIYCYFLNFNELNDIYWDRIITFANNEKYTLKCACTNQTYNKYPSKYIDLPSPEEWITQYAKSKYVITNTFHGTVFAIIFHKEFLVMKQSGEGAKQNGRVASLLKILNLENRYYNPNIDIKFQMERLINWDEVDKKINKLRESSYNYLEQILEMNNN